MYRYHTTKLITDALAKEKIRFKSVEWEGGTEAVNTEIPINDGRVKAETSIFICGNTSDVTISAICLDGIDSRNRSSVEKMCGEINARRSFLKFVARDDMVFARYYFPKGIPDEVLGDVFIDVYKLCCEIIDSEYGHLMDAALEFEEESIDDLFSQLNAKLDEEIGKVRSAPVLDTDDDELPFPLSLFDQIELDDFPLPLPGRSTVKSKKTRSLSAEKTATTEYFQKVLAAENEQTYINNTDMKAVIS